MKLKLNNFYDRLPTVIDEDWSEIITSILFSKPLEYEQQIRLLEHLFDPRSKITNEKEYKWCYSCGNGSCNHFQISVTKAKYDENMESYKEMLKDIYGEDEDE